MTWDRFPAQQKRLAKLAKEALLVQDACNLSGVAQGAAGDEQWLDY